MFGFCSTVMAPLSVVVEFFKYSFIRGKIALGNGINGISSQKKNEVNFSSVDAICER